MGKELLLVELTRSMDICRCWRGCSQARSGQLRSRPPRVSIDPIGARKPNAQRTHFGWVCGPGEIARDSARVLAEIRPGSSKRHWIALSEYVSVLDTAMSVATAAMMNPPM